jgi:hypothetical protein
VTLIKYVDLDVIFGKLMRLNKHVKALVLSENYLLFKHFLRTFNLSTERLKRAEIPADVSILKLLGENMGDIVPRQMVETRESKMAKIGDHPMQHRSEE